ncbi:hypothetical protein AB834_01765 [PVC group bacterium (ex Bugula neritina AB1)]|nr:hypothetical protein AB834_01765 [PVC group bacterium (ex Bugula neritina AB1)]
MKKTLLAIIFSMLLYTDTLVPLAISTSFSASSYSKHLLNLSNASNLMAQKDRSSQNFAFLKSFNENEIQVAAQNLSQKEFFFCDVDGTFVHEGDKTPIKDEYLKIFIDLFLSEKKIYFVTANTELVTMTAILNPLIQKIEQLEDEDMKNSLWEALQNNCALFAMAGSSKYFFDISKKTFVLDEDYCDLYAIEDSVVDRIKEHLYALSQSNYSLTPEQMNVYKEYIELVNQDLGYSFCMASEKKDFTTQIGKPLEKRGAAKQPIPYISIRKDLTEEKAIALGKKSRILQFNIRPFPGLIQKDSKYYYEAKQEKKEAMVTVGEKSRQYVANQLQEYCDELFEKRDIKHKIIVALAGSPSIDIGYNDKESVIRNTIERLSENSKRSVENIRSLSVAIGDQCYKPRGIGGDSGFVRALAKQQVSMVIAVGTSDYMLMLNFNQGKEEDLSSSLWGEEGLTKDTIKEGVFFPTIGSDKPTHENTWIVFQKAVEIIKKQS